MKELSEEYIAFTPSFRFIITISEDNDKNLKTKYRRDRLMFDENEIIVRREDFSEPPKMNNEEKVKAKIEKVKVEIEREYKEKINTRVYLKGPYISEADLTPIIFFPGTMMIQHYCSKIAWCVYNKDFLVVKASLPIVTFRITKNFVNAIISNVYDKIPFKYENIQDGENFHNGFRALDDSEQLKLQVDAAHAKNYLQKESLYTFLKNIGEDMENLPR